jgi:hypothetical protein
VIEYLIRAVEGHELPPTQHSLLADMLLPAGFGCEQADGWGDFRLRCGTTEVSFSAEDPGWQVSFEGPMAEPECERLVVMVTRQIEQASHEACEWLRIA